MPNVRLPGGQAAVPQIGETLVSPLQVVLMSAAISAEGLQPAPILVTAIDIDPDGWTILPPIETSKQVISSEIAKFLGDKYKVPELNIWQDGTVVPRFDGSSVTWFVGGTSPDWEGIPYAIAVLLESGNQSVAIEIGKSILLRAVQP